MWELAVAVETKEGAFNRKGREEKPQRSQRKSSVPLRKQILN
jgi:hypothetical protein